MQRPKILLRQSHRVAVLVLSDIAGHAASEALAAVVNFHERLFAVGWLNA
jgi:hypothetical protein